MNDLNPYCFAVNGNFNAKSSKWWNLDKDTPEGLDIDYIMSTSGYNQIIDQVTDITKASSSCLNKIFTTHPYLIKESSVKMSIFDKCHHNVILDKSRFKITLPPPYLRKVWDYGNANVENIQRSIAFIDWDFLFQNNAGERKVQILNESLNNIFLSYITNKIIKCDYKHPPWMSKVIKDKLNERSKLKLS